MLRAFWFIFILIALAAATMWLADNPGEVSLTWQGYVIETSAALLFTAVAAVAIATALLYRLWIFIRGVPSGISRHRREGRRRRGYLALSRGMVAVAAGDSGEAGRQARRADGLLDEPSLTMLLSAQSAQLEGDEKAAEKFFTEMLNNPDMEFLGVRGLLNQAVKEENRIQALELTRRASRLKPESDWVARTLFDLTTREGLWSEADDAMAGAIRKKHLSAIDARRPRAVLAHQMSGEAEAEGDMAKALKLAKKAANDTPDFIPGQLHLAALLKDSRKQRKAANVLEAAWGIAPHPDLADAYWPLSDSEDAMARMRAAQKLAGFKPNSPATYLMLARAALDASLWGDARKNLLELSATDEPLSSRYCQMMAELEEAEHADMIAAREWLVRATHSEADLAWVCEDCGNAADKWTALCGGCGGFDKFQWRRPSRVPGLIGAPVHEEEAENLPVPVESEEDPKKLPSNKDTQDIDAESPPQ